MIFKSQKGGLSNSDIMMYVAIALKHLRLMALLMCFSFLLGLTYYIYAQPVYYCQSLVRLSTLDRPTIDRSVRSDKIFSESTDRAIIKELSSPHMKERIAKRLGIKATAREIDEKYVKKIAVQLKSPNIVVDVWPYSYELARDWAKTMVEEYASYREEQRAEYRESVIKNFAQEREQMKQIIDRNLDRKFDLQTTNELTKVQIELKRLKEVPREIFIVQQRLSDMDRISKALQTPGRDIVSKLSLLAAASEAREDSRARNLSIGVGQIVPWQRESTGDVSGTVVLPQNIVTTTKSWEALDKEQRRLQMAIQEMGVKFKDGHPQMIALRKQLDGVNRGLELELESALNSFNLEYANLQDKLGQLEKKLPEYHEVTRQSEKMLTDFNFDEAEQLNWNRMAGEMGKRMEALDFWSDKERATLRFVDNVELEEAPISPDRFNLFIYSMLLGIALAIAVPFLLEYLDGTVSDVDHLEETLKIRGLGVVPKIIEPSTDTLLLVSESAKPDYQLQENFRVIRTNLIMSSESPNLPQIILITSAMPQEGKTVVSSNLAMSFAVKGEKTLLIDADLRRGRLHRLFGCQNKPGLSDVLRENKPVDEAMRPSGHPNLTIITCGKHLNAASELLDTAAFARMLGDLRQKYQRIIIDTPPVLGLAETSIIQRMVDGVLLVIWSEFTPMRSVKAAIQSLQNNGAKFSGFVLNRLDFDALGNRYKYFYYAPNYYSNYKTLEAPVTHTES
jgi:polysaccharide biosynthesis transport protein